jgi:uncharacterized membrane protein
MSGTKTRVLLAGESWVSSKTDYKGWDFFVSASYALGAGHLVRALDGSDFDLHYMPSHIAAREFPGNLEGLSEYGAVILSDIGSNTLLLHPDTYEGGKTTPNRLKLIREYVRSGGGLIMMGGYYSYQGIHGAARYHRSPIEDVLPVTMLPYDDRIEVPEGMRPQVVGDTNHPILAGIDGDWPVLLGYNEVQVKTQEGVELLLQADDEAGGHPLLVAGSYGAGRAIAWTSDVGPHWLPESFAQWPGYTTLWRNALAWVSGGG